MQPTYTKETYSSPTGQLALSQFMSKVYMWMTVGILVSGATAAYMVMNETFMFTLMSNKILFYALIFAEFGLVIWLSAGINKMSSTMATAMFLLYAAINGVTLSVFSLVYTAESIQSAFFTTAAGFAGLSAFGYFTKKDLGPVGSFCTMGLFGLVGFSLLSIFFPTMMGPATSKIYGIVGIVVFAGLTAYDTQKIKAMAPNHAILGSLKLYLDFVNLFLFVLRMMGRRK